ncbi:hypothetical protein GCG54_00003948 [Colletotrichum gloeosporioides]|uniref:SnoaL-like domain-containing protein n=1 Tax=Colletotrichum gloeosporioides TaxID=474922 RepID=A0A8H4C5Y3_COLGL|nr:uncharacterized protein GCG54_00003948 [Colletotrichum gloeosporioides]KAF3798045.1 hypothetical protein GCG54_00003948 [Colletotrichum gloeosporioides]
MSIEYNRTQFDEYAAELAGPSRDRPMRLAIEQMVRRFFHESDHKRWAKVMEFFTNFPTVISHLGQPGSIFRGRAAAIDCLKVGAEAFERTVLHTIVVDRGRVTCHIINFHMDASEDDEFHEIDHIVVVDLDKTNRIERLEYRDTTRRIKKHKGGQQVLGALVSEAEQDAIAVDYSA